jgi:hypothetical protein
VKQSSGNVAKNRNNLNNQKYLGNTNTIINLMQEKLKYLQKDQKKKIPKRTEDSVTTFIKETPNKGNSKEGFNTSTNKSKKNLDKLQIRK